MIAADRAKAFVDEILIPREVDAELGRITPENVYFCGAATHPGGSVIALNGRNAAMAVLADTRAGTPART